MPYYASCSITMWRFVWRRTRVVSLQFSALIGVVLDGPESVPVFIQCMDKFALVLVTI